MRLASVRIGTVQVGVPVDAVLHAVPAAAGLVMLPRRHEALCGVTEHDGRLVPVVDLARWVDVGISPVDGEDAPRILLLQDGVRRIGLRVDAVRGLAEAAPRDVTRVHRDDDPEEVFHSVARVRQPDAILSILDVGRLIALAAAWHEDRGAGDSGDSGTMEASSRPRPGLAQESAVAPVVYGLLQAGGLRLAVPVHHLAEVLPTPQLQTAGGGLRVFRWRGRQVAALPSTVLASSIDGGALPPFLAVIEHDGLALGLPVDAALGMQALAPAADAPPALQGLGLACYDPEGKAVVLLDSAALLARYPEAALGRRDATCARDEARTQRHNRTAHVVFEADGMASTPIDALEEVLMLAPGTASTIAWRGKAVAVRDLRPDPCSSHGQVIVVRCGDRHLACVVTHVHLLVPPGAGRLYRMGQGTQAMEFITVGEGPQQASYRTLDLACA